MSFRSVPYAQAERFRASRLLDLASTSADNPRGPIPPQNPSRLSVMLGPQAPLSQMEDCLVLSISTPSTTGRRPVLLWFHGGANVTGGGELPWYDGAGLAAEQDLVVVSVTARLGVLGYLQLPDEGPMSPATSDQLNAIRWVEQHIEGYGGDPSNITLAGQSIGATAIETMLRWGVPDGVRGAILQSGYDLGTGIAWSDAVDLSDQFVAAAGQDVRSLGVPQILELQAKFVAPSRGIVTWMPVRPDTERTLNVPLIAGWTRDDALPFVMLAKGMQDPASANVRESLAIHELNQRHFIGGTTTVVGEARSQGLATWMYEFVWTSPSPTWGVPHCAELPYLFGNAEAWRDAPMMAGADWEIIHSKGAAIRSAWASFARRQDPGEDWISAGAVALVA